MDGSRGSGSVAAGERPLIHRSRLELAIAPSAVRIARHWTADQLDRAWRARGCAPLDPDLVDSTVLVVSELVTNAIRAVSQVSQAGAVSSVGPVGMILPGRVLSFADGAGFSGLADLAGSPRSMFAPGWATSAGYAPASAPVLPPGQPTATGGRVLPPDARCAAAPASVSLVISLFSCVVRVDVHDSSLVPLPPGCRRDADDETGRGLTVVAALAQNWGWQPEPFGKAVWCELAVTSDPAGGPPAGG